MDTDMEKYFSHEMSPTPPSLFKDGYMRKTDKSDLARILQKDLTNHVSITTPQQLVVIDGGWLLHRVRWKMGELTWTS